MIVIALTGWAVLGGAVLGLIAAETWTRLRTTTGSGRPPARRRPGSGPTARDLAALAALPRFQGTDTELGELVCLRCDRPVDFDVRLGLFCPACEPAGARPGAWQTVGLRCGPAARRIRSRTPETALALAGVAPAGSSARELPLIPEAGISLPPERLSPDTAVFERSHDGMAGPI